MKPLIASVVSTLAVVLAYAIIYFTSPADPDFAGSGFSWTVTHFVPAALIATVTWITAAVTYLAGIKGTREVGFARRVLPALLLLPFVGFVVHIGWRLAPLFTHR